jgi:hypothetical protein
MIGASQPTEDYPMKYQPSRKSVSSVAAFAAPDSMSAPFTRATWWQAGEGCAVMAFICHGQVEVVRAVRAHGTPRAKRHMRAMARMAFHTLSLSYGERCSPGQRGLTK